MSTTIFVHRNDSSTPFQNWCPFQPDDLVEVVNAYGQSTVGPASSFWWGYEEELGQIGEGVIIKARKLILSGEFKNKETIKNVKIPVEVPEKIEGRFYLHSDKESSLEAFEEACDDAGYVPTGNMVDSAAYAGYEVEFQGYWEPRTSKFYATSVNGTKLQEPTEI